jgi:hypothetical protein
VDLDSWPVSHRSSRPGPIRRSKGVVRFGEDTKAAPGRRPMTMHRRLSGSSAGSGVCALPYPLFHVHVLVLCQFSLLQTITLHNIDVPARTSASLSPACCVLFNILHVNMSVRTIIGTPPACSPVRVLRCLSLLGITRSSTTFSAAVSPLSATHT